MPSRRTFLKVGLFSSAALATMGYTTRGVLWGPGVAPSKRGGYAFEFLTDGDIAVCLAVAPVLLKGAMPADDKAALETLVRGLDVTITGFPPAVQGELRELFALLRLVPSRMLLAGIWTSWDKVSPAAVDGFLERWRHSPMGLLRSAYDGLKQLTVAAWYGGDAAWPTVGYPGPPPFLAAPGGTQ